MRKYLVFLLPLILSAKTPTGWDKIPYYDCKKAVQEKKCSTPAARVIPSSLLKKETFKFEKQFETLSPNKWRYVNPTQLGIMNKYTPAGDKGKSSLGIKNCFLFKPDNATNTKPLIIFLVHGTFAKGSSDLGHGDAQDLQEGNLDEDAQVQFDGSLLFSEEEAKIFQRPICVLAYQWTGTNTKDARRCAGQELANIINTYFDGYDKIIVSHSHGCNVTNVASHFLYREEDKANNASLLLVHVASPVRETDKDYFIPVNFDRLIAFYSNEDIVQYGGTHNRMSTSFTRKFKLALNCGPVNNVRTLINGEGPSHTGLKVVLWFATPIISLIEQNLADQPDLDVNIELPTAANSDAKIQLAIRNPNKLVSDYVKEEDYSEMEDVRFVEITQPTQEILNAFTKGTWKPKVEFKVDVKCDKDWKLLNRAKIEDTLNKKTMKNGEPLKLPFIVSSKKNKKELIQEVVPAASDKFDEALTRENVDTLMDALIKVGKQLDVKPTKTGDYNFTVNIATARHLYDKASAWHKFKKSISKLVNLGIPHGQDMPSYKKYWEETEEEPAGVA